MRPNQHHAITCVSTAPIFHKTKPPGMLQWDKGTTWLRIPVCQKHICHLPNFNFHPTFTTSVIIAAPAVVWTWNLHTHTHGGILILNHQQGESQTTAVVMNAVGLFFLLYFIGVNLQNYSRLASFAWGAYLLYYIFRDTLEASLSYGWSKSIHLSCSLQHLHWTLSLHFYDFFSVPSREVCLSGDLPRRVLTKNEIVGV